MFSLTLFIHNVLNNKLVKEIIREDIATSFRWKCCSITNNMHFNNIVEHVNFVYSIV